jgi:hypothetical protein
MNRITLHPEILSKNGKKEFVVLPYEEFLALQELLDDVEDLLELRAAKQEGGSEPSLSLADAKKELGLT